MSRTTGSERNRAVGLPIAISRRSPRVLTTRDAAAVYSAPRPQLKRLTDAGLLLRLTGGVYAVPPSGREASGWTPDLEVLAGGIGAAVFGADQAVVVGMSAARLHGAVPRALGEALVAVPRQHRAVVVEGGRTVRFLMRRTDLLDAEAVPTEIGPLLVGTVEQTVLDLGHGPLHAPEFSAEREAVSALAPRLDWTVARQLATAQRRAAALRRVETLLRRSPGDVVG
ncbi:type IV toxin-antitoxin system AbiEi family antitoxin domain-containing protein [Kineococcus sp. R86509]|uniref:type IV toxin-antitoxin system AbiEi family antitoxin domain-containing protein n=1 Tax=Kineococcus sp. R86509 TaxID=3093851 RepID=UPI0036D41DE7